MLARTSLVALVLLVMPGQPQARGWLYEIDPVHTQITFFVDHLGFSRSSGRAYGAHGHFVFEPGDWSSACVVARVPVARIGFGDEEWDRRMRRGDFFDAEAHPVIAFHSTSVEVIDEQQARLHGRISVRGTEAPVTLELKLNKAAQNIAAGRFVAGFSARGTILRSDFGMTALLPRVGDEVELLIEAEGWRQPRSPGQTPRCEIASNVQESD
ncbi:MAG TPA: YceI family protein [Xanthomonadaceae bacterium]|nr:YceI family protein [Xanthomonadaceae bacterium]